MTYGISRHITSCKDEYSVFLQVRSLSIHSVMYFWLYQDSAGTMRHLSLQCYKISGILCVFHQIHGVPLSSCNTVWHIYSYKPTPQCQSMEFVLPKVGLSLRVWSLPASVCPFVCLCINHEFVCVITRHLLTVGLPNLDLRCTTPRIRSLLFW